MSVYWNMSNSISEDMFNIYQIYHRFWSWISWWANYSALGSDAIHWMMQVRPAGPHLWRDGLNQDLPSVHMDQESALLTMSVYDGLWIMSLSLWRCEERQAGFYLAFTIGLLEVFLAFTISRHVFCWGYNRWISLAWTSCDILHYFNCIISHSNLDLTHNASQWRIWHAFNLNQSFLPRGTFWTSNHCRPLRVVSFLQMAGDVRWKPAFRNIQKSSLFVIMWIFIRDTCWLGSLNFGVLEDKFWELGNTSPEKVSCRLRRRWLPFASHNLDC